MDFRDAVGLVLQDGDAVRSYWNFWIGLSVGLLGLLAGMKDKDLAHRLRPVVLTGFILFAGSNLWALYKTQEERLALQALALGLARPGNEHSVAMALSVSRPFQYVPVHLLSDIFVCVGIVRLTRRAPR